MADVGVLTAPIRGGKSRLAAEFICSELARSGRMVVTNAKLYHPCAPAGKLTVSEWLHEFSAQGVDLSRRLRLLVDAEVFEFWRYYPGFDLGVVEFKRLSAQVRNGKEHSIMVPDLQLRADMQERGELPNGCLFVIDEAHHFFGVRDWMSTGSAPDHYMAQCGKLNDDVLFVTQHPGKMDKMLMRNLTEFTEVKNLEKVRLFGGVSLKGRFRYSSYPGVPSRFEKPTEVKYFSLTDRKLHLVYDTTAGTGLTGGLQPESNKFKGRHWSVWCFMAVVLVTVAVLAPRYLTKASGVVAGGLFRSFDAGVRSVGVGVVGAPALQGGRNVGGVAGGEVRPRQREEPVVRAAVEEVVFKPAFVVSDVKVVGLAEQGGAFKVCLSDGRVLKSGRPGLFVVPDEYVQCEGLRYLWNVPVPVVAPVWNSPSVVRRTAGR